MEKNGKMEKLMVVLDFWTWEKLQCEAAKVAHCHPRIS
jgi:hypothetical protein